MIEIRHLYKAFDNHMVLRNLNMKINEGAVYGFVGPNGAGKTTTMRIIAGLLKADREERGICRQPFKRHEAAPLSGKMYDS